MNKPGAILIEILLASTIAALLSMLLIMVLTQLAGTKKQIDRSIDTTMRVMSWHQQFAKDIATIGLPLPEEKKENYDEKDRVATTTIVQSQGDEEKKIKKTVIFQGTVEDGMMHTIQFYCYNPLRWYRDDKSRPVTPSLVKVLYTMKNDSTRKNRFAIYRQEIIGDDERTTKNSSAAGYMLLDRVVNMTVQYVSKNTEEKGDTFVFNGTWPLEQSEKKIETDLPLWLEVSLTIASPIESAGKEKTYQFIYPIPIFIQDQKKSAQQTKKPEPTSSSQPAEHKKTDEKLSLSLGTMNTGSMNARSSSPLSSLQKTSGKECVYSGTKKNDNNVLLSSLPSLHRSVR